MFGWNQVQAFTMHWPSPLLCCFFVAPQSHLTFDGIVFIWNWQRRRESNPHATMCGSRLKVWWGTSHSPRHRHLKLASPLGVEPSIQPWKSCVITFRSLQGRLEYTAKDLCCFLSTPTLWHLLWDNQLHFTLFLKLWGEQDSNLQRSRRLNQIRRPAIGPCSICLLLPPPHLNWLLPWGLHPLSTAYETVRDPYLPRAFWKLATLPGFEPGLPESKSGVLTITLEGNKMELREGLAPPVCSLQESRITISAYGALNWCFRR